MTRKILIAAPTILIAFLVQSYFWVPTYEEQSKGNPERLREYITASIGDAAILNPILSADSASSQIESLVFEGLIDRDENLRFRGRLAESWEIYEEAYFYVNQDVDIPGLGRVGGQSVANLIEQGRAGALALEPKVKASLANIRSLNLLPPKTSEKSQPDQNNPDKEIKIIIREPERIQLTLTEVDQDLFSNLEILLGPLYFSDFDGTRHLNVSDPSGEISKEKTQQYAAQFLPATEHNPIIVFRLRPGVLFHDGHEFDGNDVKFTFEALMDPRNLSPRTSDYEPVKSVEVLDQLTVKIVYKRLYSLALGTWQMGILPQHLLNAEEIKREAIKEGRELKTFSLRDSKFGRHPIGCGPFVFKEWKSDQYIKLERFDDYWEGRPNYERYTYRIIPDSLMQEVEFYAGTIDNYGALPHQVARLSQDPRFQSFSSLAFGYTYIGYNMRRKPFDDVRVRKALGMAIDIDQIIKYVLYGQGEPITGPFVKQSDYYNSSITPIAYDPEGALKLLEEAGWRKGEDGWLQKDGKRFEFTLITNNGNDLRKAILAIAQNGWKKLGIDVRTDLVEWAVFIKERVNKLEFDALVLGWSMGIDPDLYQIWHSSQADPGRLNFVGFKNHEADDLILKIRQEYNHDRQVTYSHRLHEIISQEQPYTFLYVSKWTALLDKRIVIIDRDINGTPIVKKITPTKTGNYAFYFNKWMKLKEMPSFSMEG